MAKRFRDIFDEIRCFSSVQDAVIYERLAQNQKYDEATLIHLEEFAATGQ